MRVLVVAMGINPVGGGPTRSCKGMCRALAKAGVDVTLLVLHGRDPFENPCGVKVRYAEDQSCSVPDFDLVHLQGLWDPGLHRIAKACRQAKVPYVISPRGMLDPWALSVKKWKKRLALFLYQRRDLKLAAAFHATAELEASHIRAQGLHQPIFVAPNGVDVPQSLPTREVKTRGAGEQRTAIFLSRLHPGKGLLLLAEAWARVRPQGWRMLVVGPDSYGHKAEVVERVNRLGITGDWHFIDMVDDVSKWEYYRSADLLVHPSVSENFGITIAEGLAAGLPVICTDGTPWLDVRDCKCGWYIKANSVDALAAALQEATASSELNEMGRRGRQLVAERYTWAAVCDKMVRGYEEILNGRA